MSLNDVKTIRNVWDTEKCLVVQTDTEENGAWVSGRLWGLQGLLALIGPGAPGREATTSKVRYTSSTAGKCRPTKWGYGERLLVGLWEK